MPEPGTVLKWYLSEGDPVRKGDLICDVETDKTVINVEAEVDGIVERILVPEGTADLEADSELAVIAPAEEVHARQAQQAKVQEVVRETEATGTATCESKAADSALPAAAGRIFASPLARRLARESRIELEDIRGSGPDGRIVERDIIATQRPASPGADKGVGEDRAGARVGRTSVAAAHGPQTGAFDATPLSGMRRTIARRLTEAKRTIPHFYLSVDVELGSLAALRDQIAHDGARDASGNPRYKISINDFVVKALALALREVPDANVLWGEDQVLRPRDIDVGVATSIEDGLITPVVRQADLKSLASVSGEIRGLASRARNRALSPDEYQGGTSTVSNLGMYGVKEFAAIINPPQSSILAVGTASERVIARGGAPIVETVMSMTLACDHRVIDGVTGAKLLSTVKWLLEKPINLVL
jgi:pyruvate dehydrogenase E2 component (dihydrolipoamide acetyltransferase)